MKPFFPFAIASNEPKDMRDMMHKIAKFALLVCDQTSAISKQLVRELVELDCGVDSDFLVEHMKLAGLKTSASGTGHSLSYFSEGQIIFRTDGEDLESDPIVLALRQLKGVREEDSCEFSRSFRYSSKNKVENPLLPEWTVEVVFPDTFDGLFVLR